MAINGFEDWPKALLISGLFLICIIAWISGIGVNYDKDLSTPYIDTSRVQSQITETSEDAAAWGESFKSDNLFVSAGAIVLFSIWGVAKLVWNAVVTLVTIYLDIFTTLFGIPPVVTGVLTGLVIIGLIFLVWKTIKQG